MNEDNKIIAIISTPFLDGPTNTEQAQYLEQRRQYIQKIIESNVAQKMGKVISMLQGDYVVELDIDQAEALLAIESEVKQRYRKDVLIGVGDQLSQAQAALRHLEETEQVGIQVYDHDMDDDPEDVPEQDEALDEYSGNIHADPILGSRALNETNTDIANPNTVNPTTSAEQDAENVNTPSAAPVDTSAEESEDSNKPAPNILPPAPDAGELSPEEGEPVENLPPELKAKVAEMLQNIQQNKQVFDSMKQSAPELYQNVVGIVQSMVGMVKDVKQNSDIPDDSKDINNSINKQIEKHGKDKDADIADMLQQARVNKFHRYSDAKDFAKENGGNPHFYYHLLRALK